MVVLLILLISGCAIVITDFLYKKKMKVAAVAYTVLYVNIIFWMYLFFFLDVAEFGFAESRQSMLHASYFFDSFISVSKLFYKLPFDMLAAMAFAFTGIFLTIIGSFIANSISLCEAIIKIRKHIYVKHGHRRTVSFRPLTERITYRLYLRNCRLNN